MADQCTRFLVLKASSIQIIGFASAKVVIATSHEIIFSAPKKSHKKYGLASEKRT
jgi:hypothetical protein